MEDEPHPHTSNPSSPITCILALNMGVSEEDEEEEDLDEASSGTWGSSVEDIEQVTVVIGSMSENSSDSYDSFQACRERGTRRKSRSTRSTELKLPPANAFLLKNSEINQSSDAEENGETPRGLTRDCIKNFTHVASEPRVKRKRESSTAATEKPFTKSNMSTAVTVVPEGKKQNSVNAVEVRCVVVKDELSLVAADDKAMVGKSMHADAQPQVEGVNSNAAVDLKAQAPKSPDKSESGQVKDEDLSDAPEELISVDLAKQNSVNSVEVCCVVVKDELSLVDAEDKAMVGKSMHADAQSQVQGINSNAAVDHKAQAHKSPDKSVSGHVKDEDLSDAPEELSSAQLKKPHLQKRTSLRRVCVKAEKLLNKEEDKSKKKPEEPEPCIGRRLRSSVGKVCDVRRKGARSENGQETTTSLLEAQSEDRSLQVSNRLKQQKEERDSTKPTAPLSSGAKPDIVQLIDENGIYSTAKLVPGSTPGEIESLLPPHLKKASALDMDIEQVVIDEKPFQCEVCDKTFKRAWELFSHEVVHNEKRPYQCDRCETSFKRHSDFKSHRLVHTEERPYRCDLCTKTFKRSSNLQEHRRIHTGERPYHCACCEKSFKTPYELQRHMLIHCTEKPYKCSACGKEFPTSNALLLHQRQHCDDKPHACGVCGKKFTYGHSLRVHERVHTGDRPFVCHICKKAFKQSNALASHERVHTGERPFDCKTCGKAFKQSSYLVIHERSHTGERPFKCEVCQKSFARPSLLLQHHRVHSEERPYKCSLCDKNFKDVAYLAIHEKVHTGETPYKCSICDKGFAHPSNLLQHKRIHRDG